MISFISIISLVRLDEAQRILSLMTEEQKLGQIFAIDIRLLNNINASTSPADAETHFVGGIFAPQLVCPNGTSGNIANIQSVSIKQKNKLLMNSTIQNWSKVWSKFQKGLILNLTDKSSIIIDYFKLGNIHHGPQSLLGSMLYPHLLGLSNSHNKQNFKNLGQYSGTRLKEAGFNGALGPNTASTFNTQWGRTYESLGSQSQFVSDYMQSYVQSIQNRNQQKINGLLSIPKSFMSEGASKFGADQGASPVFNLTSFYNYSIQAARGAIKGGLRAIQVGSGSVNGIPNAINYFGIEAYLRAKQNFKGIVFSDYDSIHKLTVQTLPGSNFATRNLQVSAVQLLTAGVDVIILGNRQNQIARAIRSVRLAISQKLLHIQRINQAVYRILQVKLEMGLIRNGSKAAEPQTRIIEEQNWYEKVLTAAKQSLVLLKNNQNLLPINQSKLKNIIFVGQRIIDLAREPDPHLYLDYDNIGLQCGGHTLFQQGTQGSLFWSDQNKIQSNSSTILQALSKKYQSAKVIRPIYKSFTDLTQISQERQRFKLGLRSNISEFDEFNTLIVGVIGQSPYAGATGDRNIPYCYNILNNSLGCLYQPNDYYPLIPKNKTQSEYQAFAKDVINILREKNKRIPLVTIHVSGRPAPQDDVLQISDAFIAAFLPGTAGGQALAQVISGQYKLRPRGFADRQNSLSTEWPANQTQYNQFPVFKSDGVVPRIGGAYPRGYGLST